MRMSFAVPAAAGLLLGWAALAQADAPPAAPIFYCPTPGKAAPAVAPAKSAPAHGAPTRVVHTSTHRHQGCPVLRVAAEHHHWRGREPAPRVVASNNDVSASQAFIYRYERALQGLDARAADEAWAEGRRDDWRHDHPMHGPVLAQRELPPPPAPEAWRRPPERHVYAETQVEAPLPPPLPAPPVYRAPPPPRYVERPAPPPAPTPPPAPRPSVHVYALQDGHSGYRYQESEQQSERAGGWSYSEQDGHGQYRQWGDRFAGEPGRDGHRDDHFIDRRDDNHGSDSWYSEGRGEQRFAEAPRYRCPPPVPTNSCSAGPNAPVRHSDVAAAGRDAAGYLTWPGKTE